MKIYDSLTNKNIELVTNKITIYNCGPTVYNDVHIGNIRPVITFDVLHRLLLAYGFNVQMIHNITDIDDKIINRSQELNISESEVSNIYHKNYLEILKTFRIPYSNYVMPKVSDNIDGIIEYIQKLINVNAAYTTPTGDVYFDVNKIKNYGCLSHQNIDELKINTRSTIANDKKSPLDFVLWKTTNNGLK
jgi:cysteinyl-tRNA synthetase